MAAITSNCMANLKTLQSILISYQTWGPNVVDTSTSTIPNAQEQPESGGELEIVELGLALEGLAAVATEEAGADVVGAAVAHSLGGCDAKMRGIDDAGSAFGKPDDVRDVLHWPTPG